MQLVQFKVSDVIPLVRLTLKWTHGVLTFKNLRKKESYLFYLHFFDNKYIWIYTIYSYFRVHKFLMFEYLTVWIVKQNSGTANVT